MRRNQSLHCQYHQERGHTTENGDTPPRTIELFGTIWSNWSEMEGYNRFCIGPMGKETKQGQGLRGTLLQSPPLGTINVIFTVSGKTGFHPSRVMSVARLPAKDLKPESKRARVENRPPMSLFEDDKVRTIQLHNDALVITLRIGGYDVKRVMIDQGSAVEIVYHDLYNGLGLKPEDLTAYDSPLVSFDEKVVIPKG